MKKILASSALIIALCLTVSCTDKQLQSANKYVVDYAASITVVDKTVIDLEAKQLITTPAAREILDILKRANKAGQQVKDILGAISKVDPQSKAQIIGILDATSASLDPTTIEEVLGIKDAAARVSVESGLTAVRTVITSIRVAIGG